MNLKILYLTQYTFMIQSRSRAAEFYGGGKKKY